MGKLSTLVKSDLDWWRSFARMFNGKAKIIGSLDCASVYFCTDSSLTGFGATFQQDFLLGTWENPHEDLQDWVDFYHWVPPPASLICGSSSVKRQTI